MERIGINQMLTNDLENWEEKGQNRAKTYVLSASLRTPTVGPNLNSGVKTRALVRSSTQIASGAQLALVEKWAALASAALYNRSLISQNQCPKKKEKMWSKKAFYFKILPFYSISKEIGDFDY